MPKLGDDLIESLSAANELVRLRERLALAEGVIAHAKNYEDCDMGLQIALEAWRVALASSPPAKEGT